MRQPGRLEASNYGKPLFPPSQPEGTKGRGSTIRAQGPGHLSGAGAPLGNTTAAHQGAAVKEMEQTEHVFPLPLTLQFLSPVPHWQYANWQRSPFFCKRARPRREFEDKLAQDLQREYKTGIKNIEPNIGNIGFECSTHSLPLYWPGCVAMQSAMFAGNLKILFLLFTQTQMR